MIPSPGPRTAWPGPRRGTTSSFPPGRVSPRPTVSGRSRTLFRVLGFVMLHDVSPQGSVIVGRTTAQREIVGQAPASPRPRRSPGSTGPSRPRCPTTGASFSSRSRTTGTSTASSSGGRTARRPSGWGTDEASRCRPTGDGSSPHSRSMAGNSWCCSRRGRARRVAWDGPRSSPRAPRSCREASGW